MKSIAVFRALQLGDLLCAVPALRALDAAYPHARITLIGLEWARAFAARFAHYIDDFVAFPGFPGTPAFFEAMQARRFDLAIQMHGSGGLTNPVVARLGARRSAGFNMPGADFLAWRDEEHEVLRWLRLVDHLGAVERGRELEFPIEPADRREAQALGLGERPYAVIHPGSQLPSRRWLPERFAAVGDALAANGLRVVLTGSVQEKSLLEAVASAMRSQSIDLAGRTSLGALGALIAGARLLVSNDTSVSHIAAALRTPSVVVACGSDTRRWAPLDRELHRVVALDIGCRPCAWRECPIGHPCATGVGVDEVLSQIRSQQRCAA